jgi:hypothetical protein
VRATPDSVPLMANSPADSCSALSFQGCAQSQAFSHRGALLQLSEEGGMWRVQRLQ